MTPTVLEKCRICGGMIVHDQKDQTIVCLGCYRDYRFIAKEHNIVLPDIAVKP